MNLEEVLADFRKMKDLGWKARIRGGVITLARPEQKIFRDEPLAALCFYRTRKPVRNSNSIEAWRSLQLSWGIARSVDLGAHLRGDASIKALFFRRKFLKIFGLTETVRLDSRIRERQRRQETIVYQQIGARIGI